jgi:hypothetical protein
MNERIESLYKQVCGKDWAYDFDPYKAEWLAELIVKECIRIDVENPDSKPGIEIAKHFGVK